MSLKILFIILTIITCVAMGKCDLSEFYPSVKNNLTRVTWDHAVNNRTHLENALKCDVMMLEADVLLGKVSGDPKNDIVPIMGHPPATVSDLSLKEFLSSVSEFNANQTDNQKQKGVKLDFKSIEAFNASVLILRELTKKVQYPLWLNADVLEGPGLPKTKPVDPKRFLNTSKEFPNVTLSIGWTTYYDNSTVNQTYTDTQIESMNDTIYNLQLKQSISFPVRAVYAANSLEQMQKLVKNVSSSTLTIWSTETDEVDIARLKEVILAVGLDKVYVDLPKNQLEQLDLSSSANAANFNVFSMFVSTVAMAMTCNFL